MSYPGPRGGLQSAFICLVISAEHLVPTLICFHRKLIRQIFLKILHLKKKPQTKQSARAKLPIPKPCCAGVITSPAPGASPLPGFPGTCWPVFPFQVFPFQRLLPQSKRCNHSLLLPDPIIPGEPWQLSECLLVLP